jgi:hypothetical protein
MTPNDISIPTAIVAIMIATNFVLSFMLSIPPLESKIMLTKSIETFQEPHYPYKWGTPPTIS